MKHKVIYGVTREIAHEFLEMLLEDVNVKDIVGIEDSTITFKDGSTIKSVAQHEKGHRWDYAYIDKNIYEEMLEDAIFPGSNIVSATEGIKRSNRILWF